MAEKTDERLTDEKVVEIEMERLREFAKHPFKVCADSQMIQLQDSIKKYGILNPLIVRPRLKGFYEIISGHRRKYVAEKLEYRSVPVMIRYMKYDAIKRKRISFIWYSRRMMTDMVLSSGQKSMISERDFQEIYFELMENDNSNLNYVIGTLWAELDQKENMLSEKAIADFREQTEKHFHPVDGMNAGEIEEMVSYYVQAKIIENNLDIQVENVIFIRQ